MQYLKFTKMQAYGNDYVYMNAIDQSIADPNDLARKVSNRHFGIGSDGLVLICPSEPGGVPDADVQPRRQRGGDVRQRSAVFVQVRL